ncbi:endonuclease/exonuclease/phosphatase family protein [Actinoplanes sp. NPDC020271]|uniref:endonuclease/exonuclease/phosphatase family protein n=1 Tax=Actinoplanes sp. NPDC020271 TaxID=3363896 RepID=UPI0037B4F37D
MPILWVAVLAFVVVLGHRFVPHGSLIEAFLPWTGLVVPIVLLLALARRSLLGLAATLLPTLAWLITFGGYLLPRDTGTPDLTVVQHNVSDENPDPAGTARALLAAHPDLVALEELLPEAAPVYDRVLAGDLPFHTVHGTVGLWSRHPLTGAEAIDIRPHDLGTDWNRGLRAVARTPAGDVAVYVVHLPSVRIGITGFASARRDESTRRLDELVAADPAARLIVAGDLNTTVYDRGLRTLSPPPEDFAFTWPAAVPVARIDQVLARSMTVSRVRALPRTGSDHLPLAAEILLQP